MKPLWIEGFTGLLVGDDTEPAVTSDVHFAGVPIEWAEPSKVLRHRRNFWYPNLPI